MMAKSPGGRTISISTSRSNFSRAKTSARLLPPLRRHDRWAMSSRPDSDEETRNLVNLDAMTDEVDEQPRATRVVLESTDAFAPTGRSSVGRCSQGNFCATSTIDSRSGGAQDI